MRISSLPADVAELHYDAWTEPFWQSTRVERLSVPRCTTCGSFRLPPAPFCHVCRQQEVEWITLSGRGTIYTFTVIRHAVIPMAKDAIPYVIAVISLDGAPGARLLGNIVDAEPETVKIGAAVEVAWDHVSADSVIPRWRLVLGIPEISKVGVHRGGS
jgi:uncharacterized OB-fold protein